MVAPERGNFPREDVRKRPVDTEHPVRNNLGLVEKTRRNDLSLMIRLKEIRKARSLETGNDESTR